MTGTKAGERKADGTFTEGSVNFLVDKSLTTLADIMKEFGKSAEEMKEADQ